MIDGELFHAVAADEVGPAVAQSGDINLIVFLHGENGGGSHAAASTLIGPGGDNGLVRFREGGLNGVIDGILSETILQHARDDLGGETAGFFAGILTAHAVGDEKHIMLRDRRRSDLRYWAAIPEHYGCRRE